MFDLDQATLFTSQDMVIDPTLANLERRQLVRGAWVDYSPMWLHGDERLFDIVQSGADWASPEVQMYDKMVRTPRLTSRIDATMHDIIRSMSEVLSYNYGVTLDRLSAGFYRNGSDSVAWHGDRIARDRDTAIVATVSLGGPRRFLMRPESGGSSIAYSLGHGDLIVMGGTCQRTWRHAIPKVSHARPRIALMFRHRYD